MNQKNKYTKIYLVSKLFSLFLFTLTFQITFFPKKILAQDLNPQIGLLFQTWAYNDTTLEAKSNFRIRRAEIKLRGKTSPELRYFFSIDPSKSLKEGNVSRSNDNKILQDLGIEYAFMPEFKITVGQFKAPDTIESFTSSGELLLAERSIISRNYGDNRETGVMLSFEKEPLKAKLMLSNGGKTNTIDENTAKDFHARVDYIPMANFNMGSFATYLDSKQSKGFRNGVNFMISWKSWSLAAEGTTGKENDAPFKGYYTDLFYNSKTICPILRYEYLDANNVISKIYNAGLNYKLLESKAKLQLTYAYLDNVTTEAGSPKALSASKGSLVVANFQLSF